MRTVSKERQMTAAIQAVRQRNYRRARDRALTALARKYPDDYKDLLSQEKEKDETLGKKWLDLAGNTHPIDWHQSTNTTSQQATDSRTSDTDENEGDTQ